MASNNDSSDSDFLASYAVVKSHGKLKLWFELGCLEPITSRSFTRYFGFKIYHEGMIRDSRKYNNLSVAIDNANSSGRNFTSSLDNELRSIEESKD